MIFTYGYIDLCQFFSKPVKTKNNPRRLSKQFAQSERRTFFTQHLILYTSQLGKHTFRNEEYNQPF